MKEKKERFKTRITATDPSLLTEQTLYNVIADKINFVIDKVRKEEPHYIWLTKYQLVRGSSLFNSLPKEHPIRIPLVGGWGSEAHLPGRQPTKIERRKQERTFGYAMKWPPPGVMDVIQTVFRDTEDRINPDRGNIVMVPCRGYIDPNGHLIEPSWSAEERWASNMVSGYVIYRQDEKGLKKVNKYLLDPETPKYIKMQMLRAKKTGPKLRANKAEAAEAMNTKAQERLGGYMESILALQTDIDEPDWDKIKAISPASHQDLDD